MELAAAFALVSVCCALAAPGWAQSRKGELRGAWMGEGYGRDWPAIMKSLKENGFNALFPEMCTGGAAFYPSKVLPVAPGAAQGRDELAEAVKAAKQYGIELHVWRINWVLFYCPPDVLARYEREGRLMRNAEGKLAREDPTISSDFMVDWLCPSQPANRKLEKEAMLELVRKYDIAGIHFDYMRYPKPDYCYCEHCRAEFEKSLGKQVERWPQDVLEGGPYAERYADWRRGLETSLVSEISEEAHRIKPGIFVSLAAWPDLSVARNRVLQDWPAWVQAGALDFICFMDYTVKADELRKRLASHRQLIHGQIPVYAGLGSFLMKDPETLIDQIQLARSEAADGFLAYAYDRGDLDKWLPKLRETVTAADPNPMPHGGPPAVFAFQQGSAPRTLKDPRGPERAAPLPSPGPAAAKPANLERMLAGERLRVELTIGTPPGETTEEEPNGAYEAASVLRRATETRQPTTSYEPGPDVIGSPDSAPRLSGRVVVETPSGDVLASLAVFDSDLGIKRTLTFLVPEGRCRIAAYGAESFEGKQRDFVVRGPLLIGVRAEELSTPAPGGAKEAAPEASSVLEGQVDALLAGAVLQLNAADLSALTGSLQLKLTGEGGGDWWIRIGEGKAQWGRGVVETPTQQGSAAPLPSCTVTSSTQDCLALGRREADASELWDSGRVTVTGDLSFVQRMAALLGLSAAP
jgi:uncharacterized lipoprotein YddW (UPF0748 family)